MYSVVYDIITTDVVIRSHFDFRKNIQYFNVTQAEHAGSAARYVSQFLTNGEHFREHFR